MITSKTPDHIFYEHQRGWMMGRHERVSVLTDAAGIVIAKYYHLNTGRVAIWLLWGAGRDDTLCETDLPRCAEYAGGDSDDPRLILTETRLLFPRARNTRAAEVLSRFQKGLDAPLDTKSSTYRNAEYEKIFPYVLRSECIMDWSDPGRARLVVQSHQDGSLLINLDVLSHLLYGMFRHNPSSDE